MEGYTKLGKALLLSEAVEKFGLGLLHPLDRKLWEEVLEKELGNAIVTLIKKPDFVEKKEV